MFEVKATYLGETRKFTLRSDYFPSHGDVTSQVRLEELSQSTNSILIHSKLERVFTLDGPYYLSNLLFSPMKDTSVFVGHQAANEEEYNQHRSPFSGRVWPNGLLRFTVTKLDESQHLSQEHGASSQAALIDLSPQATRRRSDNDSTTHHSDPALNRYSFVSEETRQSCCSVEDGKQEMKQLMSSFLRDFNDIAASTFGHEAPLSSTQTSSSISHGNVQQAVSSPMVPNALEDYGLGIPGAFVEPIVRSPAIDNSIRCGNCSKLIDGYYHRCRTCALDIVSIYYNRIVIEY